MDRYSRSASSKQNPSQGILHELIEFYQQSLDYFDQFMN